MGSESKCRPPIGSFAGSNTGDVFFSRGDQPVKRWDGFLTDYVNAGVPKPDTALELTEVDVLDSRGDVVSSELSGTFYAYLRFLDSRGNVSSLSPLSNRLTLLGTNYGNIVDATKEPGPLNNRYRLSGQILVTSYNHGLITGETIEISNTGVPPQSGKPWRPSHLFQDGPFDVEFVDNNSFVILHPGLSYGPWWWYGAQKTYQGGAIWSKTGPGMQYSGVVIPTDDRVVKRQILRNKHGTVSTFYVDIEHTRDEWEQHVRDGLYGNVRTRDEYGTIYTTTKLDTELGEEVPLRTLDGTDLNIARHGEPPSFKKVIISHYNRMFAGVNLNYNVGSAKVVTGLTEVVGNSTCWTSSMVGRFFAPRAGNPLQEYEITEVDETTQIITLSERWEEITNLSQLYSISPGTAESLSIHYSETLLPAFEHRLFNLNYMTDPAVDGHVSFSAARGCVNHRTIIQNGTEAYMMDQRGIYAFDGSGAQDLSTPIQAVFSGDYDYAIDWSMSEHFHASHNDKDKTLRWFVSMGGFEYPRHALAYNYRVSRWWIEEYPEPISASSFGRVDSKSQNVWSGSSARSFVSTLFLSDGLPTHVEPFRGKVASATSVRINDASSTLETLWVGAPVHISEGKGEGQTRIIVKVGSGYLEVDRPFSILPDNTSKYQVGGFRWQYSTPMMLLASPPGGKAIRSFETRFEPTVNNSTLAVKKFTDFSNSPDLFEYTRPSEDGDGASTESGSGNTLIDTTFETGSVQQAFDSTEVPRSKRGRSVRFAVEGVPNGEVQKIYSLLIEGVQNQ
jgi:hypothetical protein